MKRAWHVVCEIWEVWLRFKADPRNLKREKLQNPTSAKIATKQPSDSSVLCGLIVSLLVD